MNSYGLKVLFFLLLYVLICLIYSSTHQRMLSFLAQSEFAMTKASFVHKMNMQQMEKYQQLQASVFLPGQIHNSGTGHVVEVHPKLK